MAVGKPLQTSYCFSFMRRGKATPKTGEEGSAASPGGPLAPPPATTVVAQKPQVVVDESGVVHPYESSIRTIAEVETVETFWEVYNYLKRPSDLPTTTDYHFFRGGIKPTWEDPSNAKGGKWIVRLPKGLASRYWEEIILALIGGQFGPGSIPDGEICGAVLSVRYSEDILGVWNKNATDRELVDKIRDAIKKCLQLPPHANMEYKPHQTSLADRSSFRNTQVWKPKSLGERSASLGVGGEHTSTLGSSPPGHSGGMGSSGHGHIPAVQTSNTNNSRRQTWTPQETKLKRGESTGSRWRNPS